jgi:uncharacterized membrane protein
MLPPNTVENQNAGEASQTPFSQPKWKLVSIVTLALLAGAATALRFCFLARKPFWFDECFSAEVTRLTWHDFLRLMWWREANMSLYYVLLRGWLHFGFSPFFIRSFSVLASLAVLPIIFWLSCKLFDRRVGVIAVALMTSNAYSIRYAQEARSYSLFLLLVTLSSAFFVRFLQTQSPGYRRGYVVASVLAVYAHFYTLLLVAAQWVSVQWRRAEREPEWRASGSGSLRRAWIAILVGVLPLLAFVAKTGAGPIRWIWRPTFRDVLNFWEQLAGNAGLPLLLLYAAACLAALLPMRGRLFRLRAGWDVWRCQFLLAWLFLPVILTLVLSLARPIFLGRYFIFCLPALIILAAVGLANLQKPWMTAVCLAAMLLFSLQGAFSYYDHDFDVERDGSEAADHYVLNHALAGDAILFHIAEARIPYEFFKSLRERDAQNGAVADPEVVFPRHGDHLDYRDVTGKPTGEFVQSIAGQHARVWVVLMSNGASGQPDATTVMLNQTLGEEFPRIERVQFPQVEVRLYSKR